jgi:hypothetical protein
VRFDIELLRDSYWSDSTDDHGAYVGTGWGFCEFAVAGKHLYRSCNLHIGNTQIELLGDQAKVETYFLCVIIWKNPEGHGDVNWFLGGRYKDLYERRNGEWKILRRVCLWDWNQDLPMCRTGAAEEFWKILPTMAAQLLLIRFTASDETGPVKAKWLVGRGPAIPPR